MMNARRALLGLLLILLGVGPVLPRLAAAQGRTPVLTAIGADGTLRALDGDRWVDVWPDLGHGATVTELAWHPARPELLIVRRTFSPDRPGEPSYSLVRLDLSTSTEETILDGIGPQAQILGPRFAPDGRSAFARIECCLAREVVRFGVPPADTAPIQGPARAFLDPATGEDTLVTVGPYAPDGRIVMSVFCCMGDVPPADPSGVYLVSPDLKQGERIASGVDGTPIGVGPSGAWVALLDESHSDGAGPALIAVDLPAGTRRTLVPPQDPPLATVGDVALDGRIAIAQTRADAGPWESLGDLWVVERDGSRGNVTNGSLPGVTAFAWADPDAVARARAFAAAIGPAR